MITSLTNNHVKELNKLSQKKHRQSAGLFLVEGHHLVEEAKKQGCLVEVLSTEEYDFDKVTLVKKHIIEKLASTKHPQTVIGVCTFPSIAKDSDKVIYLDVTDPVNLGTLIRSAVGFGFNIILSENSCDEFSPKVLRGTQGAIFHTSIERMDLNSALSKYEDYQAVAADMSGEEEFTVPSKVLLVMGNESLGLTDEVKQNMKLVRIETDVIESLNLSVAGSILMHKLK